MKKFSRLGYNNFIIEGEVDEQLPLYNEQSYPTCVIKENKVSNGEQSYLVSSTGVTVSDGIMNFGNSSKISLSPSLMDTTYFEIELKFKVTDMTSIIELFSSSNMKVKLNPNTRYLYLEMKDIVSTPGNYNTAFDFNTCYKISKCGAINKNIWYTLKISRFNSVIATLLNNANTRCLVYRGDLTTSNIDIKNKGQIKSISINKNIMDEDKAFPQSKTFRMNKEGNIHHELDDTGCNFMVKNSGGQKYHFPLTYDFNSECNTIISIDKPYICDGGAKSGICKAEKIIDLSVYTKDVSPVINVAWDKNLHESALRVPYWSNGYNEGVNEHTKGYHAHWANEGKDIKDVCMKFINCNEEFGLINRWLGISSSSALDEIFINASVGDKITILFSAKADIPANIKLGIYRTQISDGQKGFGPNQEYMAIKASNWENYSCDFVVDNDWNTSLGASLYFYGNYDNEATISIQDVVVMRNSTIVDVGVAKDKIDRKIKIEFSNKISLNNNWHIVYKTKILDASNNHYDSFGNDVHWGIEGNYFVVKYKNAQNQPMSYAIQGLKAKELIGEWILISLSYVSDKLTLSIYSRQGKHEITLNKTIGSLHNSTYKYDIMLGGKDNVNYGCAIYKELNIINGWNISNTLIDNFFKTKISYYNNKLYSNIDIIESTL